MRTTARALSAAAVVLGGSGLALVPARPAAATLPAPVILNNGAQNGGPAQWLETQAQPDDGGGSVKQFVATFLVQHAAGRTINGVKLDANFDGADNTASAASTFVTGQTYVAAAGGIETSRVTVSIPIGKPSGFTCSPFSGTRTVDAPVRMRVVDNTNELSSSVTGTVKFVEDANCGSRPDFPRMTSVSQNVTEVAPGQNVTYTFTCDDVDPAVGTDDDCDRANIRWRRLDDGTTSSTTLKTGLNDNSTATHTMAFPSQGYYVVEAQLGNEDGAFPNTGGATGGWWRLGNAVVNDSASSLSGSLSFTGVQPSSPPSVNAGDAASAVATAADSGGSIQVIEWDAEGNGTFERREYTVPVNSAGDIVHPSLTSTELAQSVATATAGLKTVTARVTDNGALDAADNARRQLTFSGQLRVNAVPTAANTTAATNEDEAVTVTMAGADADNQPAPLVYTIDSAPPASAGTLSAVSGNEVVFTPAADFNGTTSFTYLVEDGTAGTVGAHAPSNTATVNITVNAVNDAPTVDAKSAATSEDTPVDIQATGADVEGPLTWSVASQPTSGTAACNSTSGLCTYSPGPDFFGEDTFVVRGTDSGGLAATATFTVDVAAVNDAPVAGDQLVAPPEDAVNVEIALTASDVDSTELTFTAPVDDVDHGTLNCAGPSCTYTPAPDYNGPDSFTFSVSDGALTDTGTVSIDVTAVNDAPVAVDVPGAETNEDVVASLALGGTDVDGDAVTVAEVTDPANGTATIMGPNAVDYLGDQNFHGIDTFDFQVTDGQGAFDTGTVVVTVHPVNDAPVVEDQSADAVEDTQSAISVAAGDVDGDALSYTVANGPASGALSGAGPDFAYTPAPDFFGLDSFTVSVADGHGGVDTAVITITVAPVNDAPDAAAATQETAEDALLAFTLGASDIDDAELTYDVVTSPEHGSLNCVGSDCTYEPAGDFHGADMLVFRATDSSGASDTATVSITVTPVNDAPVAGDLSVATDEDTSLAITLPAVDVDGDVLSFVAGAPSSGVLTGTPPDVVYEPAANVFGADGFTFTVSDGNGGQDEGAVSITVREVNDPPVATDSAVETPANTAVQFNLVAGDVDGDPLAFSLIAEPESGSLSCDLSSGACTYTPATDAAGEFIVDFGVSDGRGGNDVGRVTITVLDEVAPTIAIRTPVEGSQVLLGSALVADFDCADNIAVATCVGDVADGASIDTSTPGSASFTVEAADTSGNTAMSTVDYTVVYAFTGFSAPVDNGGVVNVVSAGSRVPLRWRISGASGGVSDPASVASVTSRQIPCASETVADVVEETTSTPGGLVYQNDGRWQYTWVTTRTWKQTCRELTLRLADGTVHTALFSFR